ncbi:MAG: hypothetical protein ACRBI6_12350 [Acidimicrobiales bacterium]
MAGTAPDSRIVSVEELEAMSPEERKALYRERMKVVTLDDLPDASADFRRRVEQMTERSQ